MNEVLENIKEWTTLIENTINNDVTCPSSFEKKFCEGEELLSVSFSSSKMFVVFLEHSGQHITTSYPLQDLSDWLDAEDEYEEGVLNE